MRWVFSIAGLGTALVVFGARSITACGHVDEIVDAETPLVDGSVPCAFSTPFDAPVLVAGVNTTADEDNGSLSPDELTIYFASNRPDPNRPDSSSQSYGVYVADRDSPPDPRGAPTFLSYLTTLQHPPHP